MVTLQIFEPGSFPTKVDLADRWGPDHTVVLGVSREGVPKNHISFRKAAGYLSRRQVTIWAMDGDESQLLVRDGGKEPDGQWSRAWKHTYLNDEQLSNTEWVPFRVGDRLRFHIEKPPVSQYSVSISVDTTDDTIGLDTIRFDTVQVWSAISRTTQAAGTMLLSAPGQDGIAVVLRLDSNAERLLGGEPGELKEIEEYLILNNMLPVGENKTRLAEQVRETLVYPGQGFKGQYDFGAGLVELRLENRLVGSQHALLGWLTPKQPLSTKEAHQLGKDWRTEAVAGLVQWTKDNPRLATIVGVVLGIAIVVIRVMGD